MRTQSENKWITWCAGKRKWPSRDCIKLCIWLVEKVARVFHTNQRAKLSKINAIADYFRHPIENCCKCIVSSYKNTILPLNKWLEKYEIFFYDSIEQVAQTCLLSNFHRYNSIELLTWCAGNSCAVLRSFIAMGVFPCAFSRSPWQHQKEQ